MHKETSMKLIIMMGMIGNKKKTKHDNRNSNANDNNKNNMNDDMITTITLMII